MILMDQEKTEQNHINRLIRAIDLTYHNPGRLMWRNFLGGLLSGLGATIGVAIVLGILGVLIREFGGLPVVGAWLNDLGQILPKR